MADIKKNISDTIVGIKNINTREIFQLKNMVECKGGKIESLTICQRPDLNISLMAISEKEGLSTHSAPGDAFLTVLEGEALIKIEDTDYHLKDGDSIVMPANKPHSVDAKTDMKMSLILIK